MSQIINRIKHYISNLESHHRKIAVGFFWVSLFVLVGRLAGAAKEMAIAWRYGVSETVDAYVFVFNLVGWPVSVWFSVLTVVLVPLVARVRHKNPGELLRFRRELLGLTLITGLVLGAFVWFGLPALLRSNLLGLSENAIAAGLSMSSGLALLVPLGVVISLFSAWMLACGRHNNTLLEAIPALSILAALLLPSGWVPEPLLWGTVAGFGLHMTALALPLRARGELQTPLASFTSPAWQDFWNSASIMAVGQVLMSLTGIMDQFFAAGLGSGALSTLSYANRILALILSMGAMAISRATLPVFSEVNANGGADLNDLALRWAKWLFVIAVFLVIALWLLSPFMVEMLFERGAFKSEDSEVVSELLRYGLLQVPFYMAGLVCVSALSSRKKYGAIALISAINLVIKIILSIYLVDAFNVSGLFLSTAAMQLVSMLLCFIAVKNSKKGFL